MAKPPSYGREMGGLYLIFCLRNYPQAGGTQPFMKEPNHQEKLQALEKVSSYQRSTFIEKGGWDKMPGEEKAGSTVARACADGLAVLMKK